MKQNLQIKAALNKLHSQLRGGIWSMSNSNFQSLKSRVELLLNEDVDDTGQDMGNDGDNDFDDMGSDAPADTAVVYINGDIVYNTGLPAEMCEAFGVCDLAYLYNDLLAIRDNPDIHTVVMACCSPGGTTSNLEETIELIKEIAQTRTVIAFGTGLLASAAYNLAVNAESIFVTPSCLVGSVGAIYERFDCSQSLKNDGIKLNVIASSPKKGWGDTNTEMSTDEQKWLTDMVMKSAADFKANVLANRKIDESLLDASVFFGKDAVSNNFADANVNSLDELLETITKEN